MVERNLIKSWNGEWNNFKGSKPETGSSKIYFFNEVWYFLILRGRLKSIKWIYLISLISQALRNIVWNQNSMQRFEALCDVSIFNKVCWIDLSCMTEETSQHLTKFQEKRYDIYHKFWADSLVKTWGTGKKWHSGLWCAN